MKHRELLGLQAAIETGAIGQAQWREWADRTMLEVPQIPAWLFDLSIATERTTALAALSEGSHQTTAEPGDPDWTSARLGFLRLRFEWGEIDLPELLKQAGDMTDAANYHEPACEAFYFLLNEIDGRGPIQPSPKPLAERVAELFDRHARLARILLEELAVQPGVEPGGCSRLG